MKLRVVFVDILAYAEEPADLGDVSIVEVLEHWRTPGGYAVKLLVAENESGGTAWSPK